MGKLLKFGNEKEISEFWSREKEIVKSLKGNWEALSRYQSNKNTAFYGAWNVVVVSEI